VNLYVKVWFCFLIVVVVVTVMLFVFEGVSNQPMNLSPRIFVIICFHSRDSRGRDIAVSDMLISEGLAHAQSSDGNVGGRAWEKEIMNESHKTKVFNSEQQKKLDEQWNSLTFQPPAAQQLSWQTRSTFATDKKSDHFNTGRNAFSSSPFSSKEHSLQGGPLSSQGPFGKKAFGPSQMYHEESKHNLNDISLSNVPLPPNPNLLMQNKESDNLETFNIKRTEHGPIESLRMGRPHLASPNEFLSHSRGQDIGLSNAHSSLPKDESTPKYQPPHVRSVQTKMADTFATNAEHNLENFTSLPQRSNSSSLQQRNQQAPFSNFAFSPKLGRSHIAAQFHSNLGNKEDLSTISRPPQQQTSFQQPEFLKMQPLNENTRDKTLKAELDWKIWKFQRNVKRVLDKMVANNSEDYTHEFYKIIAESRLSQEFKGISEVSIIVKLLLEEVMDGSKFDNVAVRVCTMLRDKGIPELSDCLNKAVKECEDILMEQFSASDCHKRCLRFSSFLGRLYLEVLSEVDSTGFKSSVDSIIANSLHNWLSFDQADSVEIHSLHAVCLKSFLKVTGPTIDQTEGNEISRYFATIRDLVLSQDLAVMVKSTLLDILLLRASGWKTEEEDEQETGSEFTEGEVFAEDDVTEEQEQEGTDDQDDSKEWDPYSKVKAMLKNLKLQDLLPKFFDNCIRDSLLTADWEELKGTLQEAGFPPGVILETRMYLDKGLLERDVKKVPEKVVKKIPKATTDKKTALTSDLTQERKRTSKSPSPTKPLEQNIEINKLNQELQQLLLSGNQDNGGPRISPTRKISPQGEPSGHDGTPYSRGGPRKFVSKAERRRSSEGPPEDVPFSLTEPLIDVSERTVPFPPPLAEPVSVSTSAETSPEQSKPVSSMSYSAVLKNISSEVSKSGPVGTKPSVGTKPPNQSKTFSRPPPGLAPLPTHGGDTTMHMTVLGTKSKTKASAPASSASRNAPTRADASMNWRSDVREEQNTPGSMRQQQPQQQQQQQQQRQSGHAVKWRRFDDFVQSQPPRTAPVSESSQRKDAPAEDTDSESSEPPPVVQPHRAFGPGGLKACVICGSRDHLRCNDRSKMFF